MAHVKLHIPGPVEVSEKTFQAFRQPMIGHRGQGFKDLYAKIQPQLQQLLSTKQLVYISTSSAWGVMEGALRNLVAKKVLNCMCGAFSDKWNDVALRCGRPAGALRFDWGQPVDPDALRRVEFARLPWSHPDGLAAEPLRSGGRRQGEQVRDERPARGIEIVRMLIMT